MRRFRWVASLLIFAAALLVFFALASNRRDTVTLPSGLTVQWLGITEGTNDYVDGNILQKLLGDRIPANRGQTLLELDRILVRSDRRLVLNEAGAGVQLRGHVNHRDARLRGAVVNRPVDRGRSAITREQRSVQIDAS